MNKNNTVKNNDERRSDYDVIILGGGLSGLTLALQMKEAVPEASVCVLEKLSRPVPEAAFKVGESTVELATHYFSDILGLKEHLDKEQLPKLGLRFFFGQGSIEKRLEVGARGFPPTSSYQIDRGRFENFLWERAARLGIEVLDGASVREAEVGEHDTTHCVVYERHDSSYTVRSRWIVDASGRAGVLKRKLKLKKESSHRANAAWFRVEGQFDLDTWSEDRKWRSFLDEGLSRWLSTNHLMGEGYWVWLIPLSSGATSIGIVADENLHPISEFNSLERAVGWLERHEPQCAQKLKEQLHLVKDFCALKRYSHDCEQVFSPKRWALTGEAGVFLDPFYSPGSDFIALSNTFITNLVKLDLEGQPIGARAQFYNDLYLSFFRNTMRIFDGQYPLFGNPQIMPLKIVWDFATYWTFLAFLFFQNKLTDFQTMASLRGELERIGSVNTRMQEFFLEWHREKGERPWEVSGLDLFEIPFLEDLNTQLREPLNEVQLKLRLKENTAKLEALADDIIQRSKSPQFESAVIPQSFYSGLGV